MSTLYLAFAFGLVCAGEPEASPSTLLSLGYQSASRYPEAEASVTKIDVTYQVQKLTSSSRNLQRFAG